MFKCCVVSAPRFGNRKGTIAETGLRFGHFHIALSLRL